MTLGSAGAGAIVVAAGTGPGGSIAAWICCLERSGRRQEFIPAPRASVVTGQTITLDGGALNSGL